MCDKGGLTFGLNPYGIYPCYQVWRKSDNFPLCYCMGTAENDMFH